MGIPAIPDYLNKHLADGQSPPGHRFCLYLPVWNNDWSIPKDRKKEALDHVLPFCQSAIDLLKKIHKRQNRTADGLGKEVYRVETKSSSPFVTGVGMEHPMENGFAFLSPYGLPYLPGSGVKGVLRKAAEELALMDTEADRKGWDMIALWQLFGLEAASASLGVIGKLPRVEMLTAMATARKDAYLAAIQELGRDDALAFLKAVEAALPPRKRGQYHDNPHSFLANLVTDKKLRESVSFRGALAFWDVFPQPLGNKLGVDILNPHHSKYYQDGESPADCESPVPNFFLVVPPETDFVFHVQCERKRLPEGLREKWRKLLQVAFTHAFDWLGFGAKTAVGYGAMRVDKSADEILRQKEQEEKERLARQEQELLVREKEQAERERIDREREALEQARREAEAVEVARRQAEFDALPEIEKNMRRLQEQLAPFEEKSPLDKNRYADFAGIMNRFAETAKSWPSVEDREQAAKLMENILDRLGWTPAGLKKNKREKQEQKRRDMIEALRRGSH